MWAFASQGGSLLALWTAEATPIHLSRIRRADANGAWTTIFEDDAAFATFRQDLRRAAILEIREKPQGGGAYDATAIVLDLTTRALVKVDSYSLSSATFRGGGGAPRRPIGDIIVGGGMVAWTHLNELAAGQIEGELRVASLGDPTAFTVVGRSREWITPISVDENALIYLVGATDRDDLRARELATGTERSLVRVQQPTQTSGPSNIARGGKFAGWIEMPSPVDPSNARFRAVDVASGAIRELDLGARYCSTVTANAYGFAWTCGDARPAPTALGYFDPVQWRKADVTSATDGLLEASIDGFIWTGLVRSERRAVLYAPR